MKKTACILLWIAAALMIAALVFAVPSGSMLSEYQDRWLDDAWESEGLLRLLIPQANAEEAPASLPIDFTPGMTPNPAAYSEDGYQDDSIAVRLETREEEGVVWRIAWVDIKDPSQLRTGIAGDKVSSKRTSLVSSMAQKYNAVIAISGDYYVNDPQKTSFEYRMGQMIRSKRNRVKDILIIDENLRELRPRHRQRFHLRPRAGQRGQPGRLRHGLRLQSAGQRAAHGHRPDGPAFLCDRARRGPQQGFRGRKPSGAG